MANISKILPSDDSPSSSTLSANTSPCSTPPSSVAGWDAGIDLSVLCVTDEGKEQTLTVSDTAKTKAAEIKKEADAAFKMEDYLNAGRLYKEAMEHNPLDATLLCNRALVRIRLDQPAWALWDCTIALILNPVYVRALYLRGLCRLELKDTQPALRDFEKVLELDPKNVDARRKHTETHNLIHRLKFERAINIGGERNAVERCRELIAKGGCTVEKNYTGPTLPSEALKFSSADENQSTKERHFITHDFITTLLKWYADGKSLPRRYVWEIALGAYEAFKKEESMVEVTVEEGETADVVGDVHGQYYDYLHLLTLTGYPSENHILLMNGDLVDRGAWSIEVIVTAFAFKWLYPNHMFVNRGNHETETMNRLFGFRSETLRKYDELTYELFAHVFSSLPLATMINASQPPTSSVVDLFATLAPTGNTVPPILSPGGFKRFFVTHGGLFSRDDIVLEEIRKIPRLGLPCPKEGLMFELLWTDPQDKPGRGPNDRGSGLVFGPDVTRRWCKLNKVTGIFRSHQLREEGYQIEHDGLCTTVFSAPNYCDRNENKGAFIRVNSSGNLGYMQFYAQPHPVVKPENDDL